MVDNRGSSVFCETVSLGERLPSSPPWWGLRGKPRSAEPGLCIILTTFQGKNYSMIPVRLQKIPYRSFFRGPLVIRSVLIGGGNMDHIWRHPR